MKFSLFSSSSSTRSFTFWAGWCCVLPVILLRLTLAGGYPITDDGFYAMHAMLAHSTLSAGRGLPSLGVLQLYPTLCSFVFSWDINHLVALRLCDMAIAALVAWQLFRLLQQESGSTWFGGIVAAVFSLAVNQPLFIQNGFKNAGFMAWLCLIIALRLGLAASPEEERRYPWFLCGVLTCLGIFFRESFFPLAWLGLVSLFFYRGKRAAWFYFLGGISTAGILLAVLVLARGGITNIIDAYKMFMVMAVETGKRASNTPLWLSLSFREVCFLLPVALFLLIACVMGFRGKQIHFKRMFFWLMAAFLPLAEVVSKGGYGYHFSFALYGFAGLTAYVYRCAAYKGNLFKVIGLGLMLASLVWGCVLSFPRPFEVFNAVPQIARLLPHQRWPQEMVEKSNYLLMADAILKNSRSDASMEITGLYMSLYVVTQRLPLLHSNNHLFDIGLYALVNQFSPNDTVHYLQEKAPDIVVLSERSEYNTEVVKKALDNMPEYQAVAYIGSSDKRHYGGFTGTVFVRK